MACARPKGGEDEGPRIGERARFDQSQDETMVRMKLKVRISSLNGDIIEVGGGCVACRGFLDC